MRLPRKIADEARIAAASVVDYAQSLTVPSIRLGVTGLSRSGKTIFITSLLHNLLHGGRLPMFRPLSEARILRTYLAPQPDHALPRFGYESHIRTLTGEDRGWPDSTRSISTVRLVIDYEPVGLLGRTLGRGTLALDIVDYPGEWLLDLPLLDQDYATWSKTALALSRQPPRAALAEAWLATTAEIDAAAPQDEQRAISVATAFTAYLRACRDERVALSTVPPGRFLMPGDLEGSPALTFAPLEPPEGGKPSGDSLWSLMARRFEAYKDIVVRPFFRDHIARLDRQIVLIDALAAMNAGPAAVGDLELALSEVLIAFRHGRRGVLSSVFRPRIDRLLFAATKADHIHRTSHDRLEAITAQLTARARERAQYAGADIASVALASIRATREATVRRNGVELACITGIPIAGERIGDRTFDGTETAAVFPGELPEDPTAALTQGLPTGEQVRFVRFRPPPLEHGPTGTPVLPHIRLDRCLDYLLGDRLQ